MTPTQRGGKRRQTWVTSIPGVSRCSPPMAVGDMECVGLSAGGRRLHLCGDGVPEVPGSGLHLLRLGDWGLRRASNSIDRFSVAPQAMFAKTRRAEHTELEGGKSRGTRGVTAAVCRCRVPRKSWVFLPLHNNGSSSLAGARAPFKTSQCRSLPSKARGGCAHFYR